MGSYVATKKAIPRETVIYVRKEAAVGTLIVPVAASAIIIAGLPQINQNPSYTDSPELADSLSVLARAQDMTPAGTWSFPMVLRPSGTAGSAPLGDVLWECLLGTKTITGGTSVAYTPATTKPTFSMWVKYSNHVKFMWGCTVNQARIAQTNKGFVLVEFSGQFMGMGWVGENQLDGGEPTSETAVVVDDARPFIAGGLLWNIDEDDDNSEAGYAISSVDYDTQTVTLASGIADGSGWADDTMVGPWVPTPSVPTSYVLESRLTTIELDDVEATIKNAELVIGTPVTYDEDELTTTNFPEDFTEQQRNIAGSIGLKFRSGQIMRFYNALYGGATTTTKIELIFGTAAGKICTIQMLYAQIEMPAESISEQAVELNVGYKALASSSGEDEISVTFT